MLGSICVGDKTSCGGTVVTGSPFSDVNGRGIARQGDRITCRKNCVIVDGNITEIIDGAAMALHGARTSGGCTCLSQNNDYHGDGHAPASAAQVPPAADAGIAFMPDTAELLNEDHWIEFQLSDGNDQPIPHQPYVVIDPGGAQFSGQLDENGFARVEQIKAGLCTVNFPELGYSMGVESCQR
ncbi:PAAR domain-containing protein [Massilia sp. UMI-21]|nr:PAAR domain-containing protein [Massilia sp. UMI-21]